MHLMDEAEKLAQELAHHDPNVLERAHWLSQARKKTPFIEHSLDSLTYEESSLIKRSLFELFQNYSMEAEQKVVDSLALGLSGNSAVEWLNYQRSIAKPE